MIDISVVIIAKDAEKTIQAALESLTAFDEVILYLNDTTDRTREIAKRFENVKIVEGDFIGFGPTKNRASKFAKHEWLFSLDADEVVTQMLQDSIQACTFKNDSIYIIKRANYYKNQKIKHCGWGEEQIVRVYNKNITAFNDNLVHEKIMVKALKEIMLDGILKHYPYNSISQFVQKADYYSEIFARENVGKKSSSPSKAFFNASFSFFKTYLFKKGFLDGYVGLLIAVSHSVTNFYKYLKLYELNKENL